MKKRNPNFAWITFCFYWIFQLKQFCRGNFGNSGYCLIVSYRVVDELCRAILIIAFICSFRYDFGQHFIYIHTVLGGIAKRLALPCLAHFGNERLQPIVQADMRQNLI